MQKPISLYTLSLSAICVLSLLQNSQQASAEEVQSFTDMLGQGKPLLNIRYRLETVEQDNALSDATASTLRTRLGFETAEYFGLTLLVEGENIAAVGNENYNSATNDRTTYSSVLDPETSEINRAALGYRFGKTQLKLGRQRIKLDNQRFIGNVGFRQNEQTFDAFTLTNTSFDGHRISYMFMDKVRRFLGDDSPVGEVDMRTHIANYSYRQLNANQFTAYAYLLELDTAGFRARSSKTFGLRYTGAVDLADTQLLTQLLYTAEYANQSDYADGASGNDANYALLELGLGFSNQWTAKLGVEHLGGDGNYGFQTPLATAHAHNGIADIFAASTPADGLLDISASLSVPIAAVTSTLTFHDYRSDANSIEYGSEFDVQLSMAFKQHFRVSLEYANYLADQFDVDTEKIWATFEIFY